MADHTPGPWEIIDDLRVFPSARGALIAECHVPLINDPETDEEWESPEVKAAHETAYANARLIASAPDLLAVLKRVLGNTERAEDECRLDGFGYCYTHTSAFPCLVEQMRAAIAKAEGRDFPPQKEEE